MPDKTQNWAKKIALILFSLVLSIIAGNIVFLPFVIIVTAMHFPNIINGVIAFVGVGLYILIIVVCFKKAYRRLNKEILTE